jgi:hypothetical protein
MLGPGETPGPLNYVAQEILASPVPATLIAYLSAHPGELQQMQRQSPAVVIRTMAKLEATLERPSVPESAVVTKTTTSAPPPPQTLGRKATMPSDDAESALAAGDFSRYKTIMNRRDVAT